MWKLKTCSLRELKERLQNCGIRDRPQDLMGSGVLSGDPGCQLRTACWEPLCLSREG